MNKILLENNEYRFTDTNLPILIHGKNKSGASLYTISLAASLYTQGSKILFLCGYKQAREEFTKQVGNLNSRVNFLTKEQVNDFEKALFQFDGTIIIKNIELFDENTFDLVKERERLIISGDLSLCLFKNKILKKPFATEILFSHLNSFDTLKFEKHQGFLKSNNFQGTTSLEIV